MSVETYLCPGCDTEVPVGSHGCPRCQARAKRRKKVRSSASRKDHSHDGLDLPGEDFDYDSFVAREFGVKPHKRIGIALHWWITGAILLGILALMAFGLM